MPSKSHGGHKHTSQRKKGKVKRDFTITGAQQQAVAQDDSSVPQTLTPVPKVLKPRATPSNIMQHAYISDELRRIAILAGVMLAILVVLYFVVP